jgi:pimeloyl-ACP methyl ester carboxylesterase
MMHHVVINGGGIPVVMLHGWGADLTLMQPLAERLAPLGCTVYLFDLPGFGATPPPPSAWSVPDYAACVIETLDALNLGQVHLIGHSFGGRISIVIGAEHPERVVKLALIDSAGVPNPPKPSTQARLSIYKAIRDGLYGIGAKGAADRLRAWYGKHYGSSDYNAVSGIMRETFVKVVNQDLIPYAERITAPTLLLWGENDQDTPLWQAKRLEAAIPDAGLITFPGAGHYSYLERPAETVRILDHFFKH